MPGRQDVALLLGEAMRGEGWTGGRMEEQRRQLERRAERERRRERVRENVGKVLPIAPQWWGDDEWQTIVSESDEDGSEGEEALLVSGAPRALVGWLANGQKTPSLQYSNMLVFSPPALPEIFQSLIINFTPSMRNSEPANVLYMLARFACLTCDSSWLEDLILGATDAIEETFFVREFVDLSFFSLMHDIRVNQKISPASYSGYITPLYGYISCAVTIQSMRPASCLDHSFSLRRSSTLSSVRTLSPMILHDLDSFELIAVFVIRYVERRIDQLLDPAILDHSPLPSEFDGIQFESEWSFLRSLTPKKKPTSNPVVAKNGIISSPSLPTRSSSPIPSSPPSSHRGFASLKQSLSKGRGANTPLQSIFNDLPSQETKPNPASIIFVFDALQSFLILSGTNPALITQIWSQVFYWIACRFSSMSSDTSLKPVV